MNESMKLAFKEAFRSCGKKHGVLYDVATFQNTWMDCLEYLQELSNDQEKARDELFKEFKSEFPTGLFSYGDVVLLVSEIFALGVSLERAKSQGEIERLIDSRNDLSKRASDEMLALEAKLRSLESQLAVATEAMACASILNDRSGDLFEFFRTHSAESSRYVHAVDSMEFILKNALAEIKAMKGGV